MGIWLKNDIFICINKNFFVPLPAEMRKYISVILFSLMLLLANSFVATMSAADRKLVTCTEGYEFYVGWLLNGESALTPTTDPNLKLTLFASSIESNSIIVETASGKQSYPVAAGGSVTIELNPTDVFVDKGKAAEQIEKSLKKGVHVYSQPGKVFSLFASNKNGETSQGTVSFDATQVVPVEGLGKEYIVHTHELDRFSNQFMIVGTEDDTKVTIHLSANSKYHKADQTYPEVTLNANQVYLVTTEEPSFDFSGTTICANKNVAVFSGSQSVLIPNQNGMTDDHTYEQLLPIDKWGKHFVVPMTANYTSANVLEILPQATGTDITISGHKTLTNKTLNAGETWRIDLNTVNCLSGVVYVEASKPVASYLYTTSAGRNSYTDPNTGDYKLQGDPSSTLIPPIEHFTDTTIFMTYKNPDDGAVLTYYVNLWAKASEVSKIKMDGTSIGSKFSQVPSNPDYAFARFDISEGTHTLTAPNKVFTGYTYAMNDGQASLYTVGYDYSPEKDSLFVDEKTKLGDILTDASVHHATYMEADKRWHLEQNFDEKGKPFNDSIFICDTTTLYFPIKIASAYKEIVWEIIPASKRDYKAPVHQTTAQTLEHKFELLPAEKDKNREPFEDFDLHCLIYREPIVCSNLDPDTLFATIRVFREFNDTTWRVVCETDTVHFFYDNHNHGKTGPNTESIFKYKKNDVAHDTIAFYSGDNTYTRTYQTVFGCDSIVTLKLFGCDTIYHFLDTTVCEKNFQKLKDSLNNKLGRFKQTSFVIKTQAQLKEMALNGGLAPYTATYKDAQKSKSCLDVDDENSPEGKLMAEYKKHCKDFVGCPDTFELKLTIVPLLHYPEMVPPDTYWCIGDNPNAPEWKRADGTLVTDKNGVPRKILETDPEFGGGNVGIYQDTVWYSCPDCPGGKCPIERDVIVVHIARDEEDTVHICQTESHYHKYGGGNNVTYYGWDYTTPDKLYPNEAVNDERLIDPPIAGATCQYKHRFVLYVHKTYVDDSGKGLGNEIKF